MSKDGQAIATDNGYIGEDGADFTSAQPEGKIVVGGSSSVSPLMEKLIEAYKTVNPNAELELQTTDSTTGVSGALEGTYTIGMASRELKDSEVEGGAKATVLALDGIAVVVNPGNTTDDLTVDQIKGIYTGELTAWSGCAVKRYRLPRRGGACPRSGPTRGGYPKMTRSRVGRARPPPSGAAAPPVRPLGAGFLGIITNLRA